MKDDAAPIGAVGENMPSGLETPLAAERILMAAAALLRVRGAGELSMQEIADAAGVSKGLIHYHFQDKDALFLRLVAHFEETLEERGRAALTASTPASVVDDLRRWVDAEVACGDWRALLLLATSTNPEVRARVARAQRALSALAESTSQRLHVLLGLRPRIAPALVGQLLMTVVSGLVLLDEADAAINVRGVYDVLILGVIALAERPHRGRDSGAD